MNITIIRAGIAGFAGLLASSALAAPPAPGAVEVPPSAQPEVQYLQQQQNQSNVQSQQMYDHFETLDERALASKPRLEISMLPAMQQAVEDANNAINTCNDQMINGSLKNNMWSARCSNPKILHIFESASYPYMDLIEGFAAQRKKLALRVDSHEITEQQQNDLLNRYLNYMAQQERSRAITTNTGGVSPY